MSHLGEHSTKVFWFQARIPGSIPGKRGFFGSLFLASILSGKIPGSIPGKMPPFQSATVVAISGYFLELRRCRRGEWGSDEIETVDLALKMSCSLFVEEVNGAQMRLKHYDCSLVQIVQLVVEEVNGAQMRLKQKVELLQYIGRKVEKVNGAQMRLKHPLAHRNLSIKA